MLKTWYAYIYGDPLDVKSYRRIENKPGFLCGQRICAIYVQDSGTHPASLSKNMISYINKGLSSEMMQPEKPYDAKKYVYLKH